MTKGRLPTPPRHLRPSTKAWWRQVVATFDLEAHHLAVLRAAAEAWDRYQQARELLDAEGIVLRDRWGQSKPHPATVTERDSRAAFCRAVAQLGLDVPAPGTGR